MSEPLALREDKDGVAIVTLNRPKKLNAINYEMLDVIFQAIDALRENDDLRVLLIRANGRFFCAGVDITENEGRSAGMREGPMPDSGITIRRDYRTHLHTRFDEMEAIEKPIVMAVHAPCLGVGLEMAGACDFRLAAQSAEFGLPEVAIGAIAGSGGISRITRLIGPGWSKWLSMANKRISAERAVNIGLVQDIYPDDEFEDRVWEFCQDLIALPQEVVGVAKLTVELCWDLDRQGARHVERIVNTPFLLGDRQALQDKVLGKKG